MANTVISSPDIDYVRSVLKAVLVELKNQLAAQNITLDLNAIKKAVDEN